MLTSDGDDGRMIWFGYSEAEVKFKFNAFIPKIFDSNRSLNNPNVRSKG